MEGDKGQVSNTENHGGMIDGADSRQHTGQIVYRGTRDGGRHGEIIVTRNSQILRPHDSQQIYNHSLDGFEWGYGGSGPAQLALALLLDATGDPDTALSLHQAFKSQWVESWPETWEITAARIVDWVNNTQEIRRIIAWSRDGEPPATPAPGSATVQAQTYTLT